MLKKVILKDGRTLAYEEFGDPDGRPLFLFHGWPSSRLSGAHANKAAKILKLRIICPDRPGFGYSTYKPNRKLLDWPNDVIELADHLKINKFSIIGGSGGGPYAAACAYKIPQRLISATIYAGLGPIKVKDKKGLSNKQKIWLNIAAFCGTKTYPVLLIYKFLMDHFLGVYRWVAMFGKSKVDKRLAKVKDFKEISDRSYKEAYRQGVRGPALDWKIYSTDWGFELKDIKMKIRLWHGTDDRNVPLWMGKYVASRLNKCKYTIVPDAGHFLMALTGERMLQEI